MEKADIGIITFHCADDYGAMLQAYGLKTYLCESGLKADIIRYEPSFMTGRYRWLPYIPIKGIMMTLGVGLSQWREHRKMKKDFFRLKSSMRSFRKKYLINPNHRKLFFAWQLKNFRYKYYIVGSDQIWNPDITLGLRKVYFGMFKNEWKEKVVAYAASLGGEALPSGYDTQFGEFVKHVNAVSVREKEAVSYVKKFYDGEVLAVLDPVFLLEKKQWEKIENEPGKKRYILVYVTEMNDELMEYVKRISESKNLSVVELRTGTGAASTEFEIDYTAGPAEFLGYIHHADYVVTNSFHATAFSIIYQKRFIVFPHRKLSARLYNILEIHGLEERLYKKDSLSLLDNYINWAEVKRRTKETVNCSADFLKENIS